MGNLVRDLVSVANQLDSMQKYAEADVLTKVADSVTEEDRIRGDIKYIEKKIQRLLDSLPEGSDGKKVGTEREIRDLRRLRAERDNLQAKLPNKPKSTPHPDTKNPFLNPGEGHPSFY